MAIHDGINSCLAHFVLYGKSTIFANLIWRTAGIG